MKKILICWLGKADVQALQDTDNIGPIAKALKHLPCDDIHIISNLGAEDNSRYETWLRDWTPGKIEIHSANIPSPASKEDVSAETVKVVDKIKAQCREEALLTFHQSSGEPIMGEVLYKLARDPYFPAALIRVSIDPEDIGIRLDLVLSGTKIVPSIISPTDQQIGRVLAGFPLDVFEHLPITFKSAAMKKAVAMALKVAQHSGVTVLIEGESGSGKEGIAKLIHDASPRKEKPYKTLNCGAIQEGLIESQLFGSVKWAFTDAKKDQPGFFAAADQGTIFLDEVGELSPNAQTKLLRVLQEGEVIPVGSTQAKKVDVRVIAATNRTIAEEVASGKFRSDLFYRLAVGVIKVPPLRERQEDVDLIIDEILKDINDKSADIKGFESKNLSLNARKFIYSYTWPGNVRELQNTLWRAAIWSPEATIQEQDIKDSIITVTSSSDGILYRPLGNEFSLPELNAEVIRHYLIRAMKEANGIKRLATILLGLSNHQTLTNWIKKYHMDPFWHDDCKMK